MNYLKGSLVSLVEWLGEIYSNGHYLRKSSYSAVCRASVALCLHTGCSLFQSCLCSWPLSTIVTACNTCFNVKIFCSFLELTSSFIILYQQMHFNISYNVRILYGTLLHVSTPWCHPQGAARSLLKLHTIIILQNVMAKIKSWLKLIKSIKTARVVGSGCICNGCDVAAMLVWSGLESCQVGNEILVSANCGAIWLTKKWLRWRNLIPCIFWSWIHVLFLFV